MADEPEVVGWVKVADLIENEDWADTIPEATLREALEAAHEQCVADLPLRPTPPVIPARWVLAQKLQARALIRSTYTGRNDEAGLDALAVTVYPMDWTVKNLLRPKRPGRRGPR